MDIGYGTAHVFFQEIQTLGACGGLRRSHMLGVEDNRLDSILELLPCHYLPRRLFWKGSLFFFFFKAKLEVVCDKISDMRSENEANSTTEEVNLLL